MPMGVKASSIESKTLERACRLYATNALAAKALGIGSAALKRECKKRGILTPNERKQARNEPN